MSLSSGMYPPSPGMNSMYMAPPPPYPGPPSAAVPSAPTHAGPSTSGAPTPWMEPGMPGTAVGQRLSFDFKWGMTTSDL